MDCLVRLRILGVSLSVLPGDARRGADVSRRGCHREPVRGFAGSALSGREIRPRRAPAAPAGRARSLRADPAPHADASRALRAQDARSPGCETAAFEQSKPVRTQPQSPDAMAFSELPSESASTLVAPPKAATAEEACTAAEQAGASAHQAAVPQPKKPVKEVSLPAAAPDEPMGFLSGATAAMPPPAAKPQRGRDRRAGAVQHARYSPGTTRSHSRPVPRSLHLRCSTR